MNKNQAIRIVNSGTGHNKLSIQNTHWSNVVIYGNEEGWWLNTPFINSQKS